MADAGIVRNRAKIDATIGNARAYLEFPRRRVHRASAGRSSTASRATTPSRRLRPGPGRNRREQRAVEGALAARGFRFVGPTIVYAWMQACGLVNNHLTTCFRYVQVKRT